MEVDDTRRIAIQFRSEDGESIGNPIDISLDSTRQQLQTIVNRLLENDEPIPCSLFVTGQEIKDSIGETLNGAAKEEGSAGSSVSLEQVLEVIYQPQAIFRVRPVTRCTSSIPGHGEAITCLSFSPDGQHLASGSGDTSVRFWDVSTETPQFTAQGHKHWVLCVSWSPNGRYLASGCKNGELRIWNPKTGELIPRGYLQGHKKWISALCWEPLHLCNDPDGDCRNIASGSKDGTVCIWDILKGCCIRTLAGHTAGITALRWCGDGLIVSASQDRTLKVWRPSDGVLCRTLQGHGHWVNTMALNTDYAMRISAFDPAEVSSSGMETTLEKLTGSELVKRARAGYEAAKGSEPERLVSGSDDFTLFLWRPSVDKKPICRMTGHQQLINQVCFSPDGRLIASASFDKSIKLWDGRTGKYMTSFRGHVQAVYQIAWSADSRLLCSGSADSTLKLWSIRSQKLAGDLPGHADEVYAVDWSPDGRRVASGGKDKLIKIWRH